MSNHEGARYKRVFCHLVLSKRTTFGGGGSDDDDDHRNQRVAALLLDAKMCAQMGDKQASLMLSDADHHCNDAKAQVWLVLIVKNDNDDNETRRFARL